MGTIGFLTPIKFNCQHASFSEKLLEKVDHYLYLGGRKAYVIKNQDGRKEAVVSEGRISLGELAFKLLTFALPIIPLVALMMKSALRACHSFYKIDVEAELGKGINVESTARKVQSLMKKILTQEEDDNIEVINAGNSFVFRLKDEPNLVLKFPTRQARVLVNDQVIAGNPLMDHRYKGMIKAKEICMAHQLDLLKVPHAKKFEVELEGERYTLIAEEKMNIDVEEAIQENNYKLNGLDRTLQQLTTFIAKTGFSDVTWRNIPLIKPQSQHKVALIDLEEMNGARTGILGAFQRRGLIRCVNEDQIDLVIRQARKEGLEISSLTIKELKKERLAEIEKNRKIAEFHRVQKITGSKSIEVDFKKLGFDKTKHVVRRIKADLTGITNLPDMYEDAKMTLKDIAKDLIKQMNAALKKNQKHTFIKQKRSLFLNLGDAGLSGYKTENLIKILRALKDQNYIFDFTTSGFNLHIQA